MWLGKHRRGRSQLISAGKQEGCLRGGKETVCWCVCVCGRREGAGRVERCFDWTTNEACLGWGSDKLIKTPACQPSRLPLKEFARLPLSPTVPLNDVNQERRGGVGGVKCQFGCSLMSLLFDAREETPRKRATGPSHFPPSWEVMSSRHLFSNDPKLLKLNNFILPPAQLFVVFLNLFNFKESLQEHLKQNSDDFCV